MPGRFRLHVFVCTNERPPGAPKPSCRRRGSEAVLSAFKKAIRERGLDGEVRANSCGCLDACSQGVAVVVYPEGVWYGSIREQDVARIVEEHLVGGKPVEALRLSERG